MNDSDSLDHLREIWKKAPINTARLDSNARSIEGELGRSRPAGYARILARDYNRMSWFALIVIAMSVPLKFIGCPMWLCVVYALFGLCAVVWNFFLARYISHIDFMTLPVVQSIEKAVRIRMLQRRLLLLSSVLGILVIVPLLKFFYEAEPEHSMFWGGVVGGVLGLIVGVRKEILFFRRSRELLRSLQDEQAQ